MKTALVLGAGGFIGSHMVKRLKAEGYWVRGVDLKHPDFSPTEADEFLVYDLRDPLKVSLVMFGPNQSSLSIGSFDEVYQFAALMGGAGYIFTGDHDADVMHSSALINLNVVHHASYFGVKKLFYSSSACMYPQELQNEDFAIKGQHIMNVYGLKESEAYPANPDSEYGWEKLFSERLYLAYSRNYGLNIRIARFHNIYGPEGTYKGGKEKAPAAMCRKVIELQHATKSDDHNEIEIWGSGQQTRSFLYIDDCIDAVRLLMQSDFKEPINIGSEEMVTINELADMAISFSNQIFAKRHIDGPIGVMGRNSDNTLIENVLGWKPKFSLREGLERTFWWIKSQYEK